MCSPWGSNDIVRHTSRDQGSTQLFGIDGATADRMRCEYSMAFALIGIVFTDVD